MLIKIKAASLAIFYIISFVVGLGVLIWAIETYPAHIFFTFFAAIVGILVGWVFMEVYKPILKKMKTKEANKRLKKEIDDIMTVMETDDTD